MQILYSCKKINLHSFTVKIHEEYEFHILHSPNFPQTYICYIMHHACIHNNGNTFHVYIIYVYVKLITSRDNMYASEKNKTK